MDMTKLTSKLRAGLIAFGLSTIFIGGKIYSFIDAQAEDYASKNSLVNQIAKIERNEHDLRFQDKNEAFYRHSYDPNYLKDIFSKEKGLNPEDKENFNMAYNRYIAKRDMKTLGAIIVGIGSLITYCGLKRAL